MTKTEKEIRFKTLRSKTIKALEHKIHVQFKKQYMPNGETIVIFTYDVYKISDGKRIHQYKGLSNRIAEPLVSLQKYVTQDQFNQLFDYCMKTVIHTLPMILKKF